MVRLSGRKKKVICVICLNKVCLYIYLSSVSLFELVRDMATHSGCRPLPILYPVYAVKPFILLIEQGRGREGNHGKNRGKTREPGRDSQRDRMTLHTSSIPDGFSKFLCLP